MPFWETPPPRSIHGGRRHAFFDEGAGPRSEGRYPPAAVNGPKTAPRISRPDTNYPRRQPTEVPVKAPSAFLLPGHSTGEVVLPHPAPSAYATSATPRRMATPLCCWAGSPPPATP